MISESIDASYILPIRANGTAHVSELSTYLRSIHRMQIIVVDASDDATFAALGAALPSSIEHVKPDPDIAGVNGKVRGVLTGLRCAIHEKVVIADDDVRYDPWSLRAVVSALDRYDIVRPQNYFSPLPWHALLDSSRTLINRALDGDWPGTLAFNSSFAPRGYNPDALFENLELVRTVKARGGRETVRRDIYVRRLPPTTRHYFTQRVRQAYDEFARPARLLAALGILPLCIAAIAANRPVVPCAIAAGSMIAATIGLLRADGFRYLPWAAVLTAPLWVLERAICAWLAVYERLRFGGVRYAGRIIKHAASTQRELRQKWAV